jgi:hypothetical protein
MVDRLCAAKMTEFTQFRERLGYLDTTIERLTALKILAEEKRAEALHQVQHQRTVVAEIQQRHQQQLKKKRKRRRKRQQETDHANRTHGTTGVTFRGRGRGRPPAETRTERDIYETGNPWQIHRYDSESPVNTQPLLEWLADLTTWYEQVEEKRTQVDKLTSAQKQVRLLKVKIERFAELITGIEKRRSDIGSDTKFALLQTNSPEYLHTYSKLCKQRDETGWLQDPVQRATAFNSINERIDYLRIKFELEFCREDLPKATIVAYETYIKNNGQRLDYEIASNAPPKLEPTEQDLQDEQDEDDEQYNNNAGSADETVGTGPNPVAKRRRIKPRHGAAVFCRATPLGTGRVAKAIIRDRKELYESLLQQSRMAEYRCPQCASFLDRDTTGYRDICHNCNFSCAVSTTTFEWDDYDMSRSSKKVEYKYERLNHLREYLRHIQGQGRKEGLDAIARELQREFELMHVSFDTVTEEMVKKRLRAMFKRTKDSRYERFYEQRFLLAAVINPDCGVLHIEPDHHTILCEFFERVEEAFNSIRHEFKWRKNYMGYPYICYKCCQYMGWDQYINAFKLLKTDTLIRQQDLIWRRLCQVMRMRYIKTAGNLDATLKQ